MSDNRTDSTSVLSGSAPTRAASGGRVLPVEKWLLKQILSAIGTPPIRIVLWDGQTYHGDATGSPPTVLFKSRNALWKVVANPSLHFGEQYSAGEIEVEGDLAEFVERVYRARLSAEGPLRGALIGNRRRNTLTGSRKNIQHHYDLGNAFYRLWLDETMAYTCAYFPAEESTLEAAQVAKMEHICRKLRLQPGERVVEAGCGWGGLARHMARHHGVKVKAFNISHEQITYAREAAAREGLGDRVEFIEDDYRTIGASRAGEYDAFVSVGMLEHVGKEHYRDLGQVIHRCLTPHGRGLIHSIGQNRPFPLGDWLDKHIFPGAYPPTLAEMTSIMDPGHFTVLDVENLRLHYARTLACWLDRFEAQEERVEAMYDREFVRAWRLYLAGSMAAFSSGTLQLYQMLFARTGHNDLPLTRAHLYQP